MAAGELLEKIRADGRARVAAVEKERDRAVEEIERRSAEELAKLEQEHEERVSRETGTILERARSRARLEQRNRLLRAKWDVIERVLRLAAERLVESEEYPGFLRGIVGWFGKKGDRIRLSAADTARLGEELGVQLGEPAAIRGGVIIEQGRVALDFSVDQAVAAIRARLAPELEEIFFPEERGSGR